MTIIALLRPVRAVEASKPATVVDVLSALPALWVRSGALAEAADWFRQAGVIEGQDALSVLVRVTFVVEIGVVALLALLAAVEVGDEAVGVLHRLIAGGVVVEGGFVAHSAFPLRGAVQAAFRAVVIRCFGVDLFRSDSCREEAKDRDEDQNSQVSRFF